MSEYRCVVYDVRHNTSHDKLMANVTPTTLWACIRAEVRNALSEKVYNATSQVSFPLVDTLENKDE